VAANSAVRIDAAEKIRRRKVFMTVVGPKLLRPAPRPRFGAGGGHDGWVLEKGVGGG
jgi:hypothetical protein